MRPKKTEVATKGARCIVFYISQARTAAGVWLAMLIFACAFASVAQAGLICNNGFCFRCEGRTACFGDACTCDGVAVKPGKTSVLNGPCGEHPTAPHPNGGGGVATTASVEASVFLSSDSAVCGKSIVSGPARLINGTVVNGHSRISGQSMVDSSTVNGTSVVLNSSVTNSTLNGNVRVTSSTVVNSTLNGQASADNANVSDSLLNGNAKVANQEIQGEILNY